MTHGLWGEDGDFDEHVMGFHQDLYLENWSLFLIITESPISATFFYSKNFLLVLFHIKFVPLHRMQINKNRNYRLQNFFFKFTGLYWVIEWFSWLTILPAAMLIAFPICYNYNKLLSFVQYTFLCCKSEKKWKKCWKKYVKLWFYKFVFTFVDNLFSYQYDMI